MTLNEIIDWANANGVDFDALVSVPYHDAVDVDELDKQYFAGTGQYGLVIRIF